MRGVLDGGTRLDDALCDQFEGECRSGRYPSIEPILARVEAGKRAGLLEELLRLELFYRLRQGQSPRADDYRQRFADFPGVVDSAFAPAAPVPALTLAAVEGPEQGRTFVCPVGGKVRVGRSAGAHLRLADPHVSRGQCLVEAGPTGWWVTVFGTKNRTLLNDAPLGPNRPACLREGDRLRVGRTTLVVSLASVGGIDEHDTLILPAATPPAGDAGPKSLASTVTRKPDDSVLRTADPSAAEFTPAPPHPDRLGHYRIEREIGRGGMGVVYLAADERDPKNRVALKTIIPAVEYNESQILRFRREADILKNLKHHHIVPFLESGEEEGTLFLAMEYIEGTDAKRMVEKEPVAVRTAVGMICQLLSALKYAHDKGYVHRDIKPGNLLVEIKEGKKSVKLADFGMARIYQDSRLSGLTHEGDLGGTIAFMAPEQITSLRETPPAADQYSTAATLYNLLTRKVIFDFPEGRDRLEVILKDEPVPILSRRPELPPDLAAVIHRALAKEPRQRYPDAQSFRAALTAFA